MSHVGLHQGVEAFGSTVRVPRNGEDQLPRRYGGPLWQAIGVGVGPERLKA